MGLIWCSAFLLGVTVFAPLESLILCVDYYNASFPVRTSTVVMNIHVPADSLRRDFEHAAAIAMLL
jgi:hypothetical protein